MKRLGLLASLLVVLSFLAVPPPGQAASLDYDIAGGHFYKQANGQGGVGETGFAITDEGGIRFWSEFKRLGGVSVLGYPASRRFKLPGDNFWLQATQKVILQWRPEVGQVYFVNVLDILHDRGYDDWLYVVRATPNQMDTKGDTNKGWNEVVQSHLALLDANRAIKAAYYSVDDWLNLNGLPMSKVEDFGSVYVLRAQRKVYQQWKVDVPWARAGQVTVANGGDIAKEADLVPKEAAAPELPSGSSAPGSGATPAPVTAPSTPAPAGFGYGMQVNPGDNLDAALKLVKEAGFGWVKVQFGWEDLETSKGNFNWGFIDDVVNKTNAQGLKLLASVVKAPRWARPGDSDLSVSGPPANYQDYADFVSALATRHKGKIHAYEIWNEQNLWYEWGGTGHRLSASSYVSLLKGAYQAIKAADPSAIVVSGAPTPTGVNDGDIAIDDVEYLKQMYAAGLKQWSDAIAAHPSGFNNPPDDTPSKKTVTSTSFKGHWSFYYRNFENYRSVMVANGDSDKKIWFTEFGWASSANPYSEYAYAADNSEQNQADYLVRAFQIAKEKGYIGGLFVWNLNFAPSADAADRYAKRAFAILKDDWTPRLAYNALKNMPK